MTTTLDFGTVRVHWLNSMATAMYVAGALWADGWTSEITPIEDRAGATVQLIARYTGGKVTA